MSVTLDSAPPAAVSPPSAVGGAGSTRRRRGATTGLRLRGASGVSLGVAVTWFSLIVLIPLVAVVGKAFDGGWSAFWTAIDGDAASSAIKLTVELAVLVAVVNGVMGTLVAWVLVRDRFWGKPLIEFVIDIPFALPTVVAGVVMLALYGHPDSSWAPYLVGTRTGLFVALLFVTLPFTVRTVQPVLVDLDRQAEQAAASLGASPIAVFRRIVAPQLLPAAVSGASLAFARALGEYGSLVFLSSGLKDRTLASMLIYGDLENPDNAALHTQQASAIAVVLLAVSALGLVLVDQVRRRTARRG